MAMEKFLRIHEKESGESTVGSASLWPSLRCIIVPIIAQYYCKEAALTSFTWARYSDFARRVRSAALSAERQQCVNATHSASGVPMLHPRREPLGIAGRVQGDARRPVLGRRVILELAVQPLEM